MSNPTPFKLATTLKPAGDQPKAISALIDGLDKGFGRQTLLGVTGSGKTFTAANVIAAYGKPTLVIAHNKTLAAQLAQEYREFFPDNAVHYFVSYYDYYQPEAYIPSSDTYIEKEAMINEEIERLRHASTQALLTRKDVIIVASVSCIYGLGSPEEYEKVNLKLSIGMELSRSELIRKLIDIHFERTNADLKSGQFRAVGNTLEVMPVNDKTIYRIEYGNASAEPTGADGTSLSTALPFGRIAVPSEMPSAPNRGGVIGAITELDPVSRSVRGHHETVYVFPAKHFISSDDQNAKAFETIKAELEGRLKVLEKEGKLLEAERLKRRVKYDLSMIKEIGYTNGIENYSRHFSGKMPGEPPDTLLSYFPHDKDGKPDFLTIVDESHVTIPQLNGMFAGDSSRKETLVEHGFRLPSAKDNRPLKFDEFIERVGPMIFTSATPADYERKESQQIVEQVIRPTGLVDPEVEIRPIREATHSARKTSLKSVDVAIPAAHSVIPAPGFRRGQAPAGIQGQKAEIGVSGNAMDSGLRRNDTKGSRNDKIGTSMSPASLLKSDENFVTSQKSSKGITRRAASYQGQIFDFIDEAERTIKKGDRVLATTLTKKMAEDLSEFLKEKKIKAAYLHSDIKTIERINILTDFRRGKYDILVGVNLLREGLDLPEVSLISILDADKEGFLRSETSLIQTIGRAARNAAGKVILYADNMTGSMTNAIRETDRRRAIQVAYNKQHGITPTTIIKAIHDITDQLRTEHEKAVGEMVRVDEALAHSDPKRLMRMKEEAMAEAVKALDFETAALVRDELFKLQERFGVGKRTGRKNK